MRVDRFIQVLDKIEAEPEHWEQSRWHSSCGTKHCFAGWAQLMSGKEDGWGCTAREDAMEWLELTDVEAQHLFHTNRTIADFKEFLKLHMSIDELELQLCEEVVK